MKKKYDANSFSKILEAAKDINDKDDYANGSQQFDYTDQAATEYGNLAQVHKDTNKAK